MADALQVLIRRLLVADARGTEDAHLRAMDVARKLSARMLSPAAKERREGKRVIVHTYRAHYAEGASRPTLEVLVHSDAESRDAVQAELTTAHTDGSLGFPSLDSDPLRELHQHISAPERSIA